MDLMLASTFRLHQPMTLTHKKLPVSSIEIASKVILDTLCAAPEDDDDLQLFQAHSAPVLKSIQDPNIRPADLDSSSTGAVLRHFADLNPRGTVSDGSFTEALGHDRNCSVDAPRSKRLPSESRSAFAIESDLPR